MRGDTVEVSGIWLRRIGEEMQVLAEVDGEWRLIMSEHPDDNVSHIMEPAGIMAAAVWAG
jgi:hypothetical protein